MKPIYQLKVKDDNADLYIYGDIASDGYKWSSSDISANDIVKQLQGINAKTISVYINSYGGEVAQGLAIYNALKRHNAKVTTYCDGFACSIASVIFMAGDVRKMCENSLLMIHNAWTWAQGNADELEKQAEDLRIINSATKKAYIDAVNISEEELTAMLDAETWITPEKAVEMGFATEIVAEKKPEKASANAKKSLFAMLAKATQQKTEEETPEDDKKPPEEEKPEDDEIKSVLTDIVGRLEKLEKKVFEDEKEENPEEENPEGDKKPPEEKANDLINKFLNSF